jgi:hypothetical protein
LYFGGSGGSGGYGNAYTSGISGKGGDGGGIIYISCDSLFIIGSIISNGQDGENGQTISSTGGGGGAGGSIYLILSKPVNIGNNFILATGGQLGQGLSSPNGGYGGIGRIRIDVLTLDGTSNPPVGYNGISYALSGSSITQPLIKTPAQCWGVLTYNKNTTAPGTSVIVDVLSNTEDVLQPDISTGSALNVTNDTIKLRISLLNSFGNQTPVLYDWMLSLAEAPPAIITPAGNTTFCQGNSVILYANTGTGYTYKWLLNGNIITGANSSSYTATQSGSYSVIVTSVCSATSLPVIVTVYPLPNANAGTDMMVCEGTPVILTATGGTTYEWDNGVIQGIPFTPATTMVYTVTVTNSYGCTATDDIMVTVNPIPPTPAISQNGNILNSTAPDGNQWYLNGTAIGGATDPTLNVVDDGVYYVLVTLNGCISDTSNFIPFTSGIGESQRANQIFIYPNPNNGEFHLEVMIDGKKDLSLKIIDYLGKTLYFKEPGKYTGRFSETVKLPCLPSGIYKLIVTIDHEIITKNIVIRK